MKLSVIFWTETYLTFDYAAIIVLDTKMDVFSAKHQTFTFLKHFWIESEASFVQEVPSAEYAMDHWACWVEVGRRSNIQL